MLNICALPYYFSRCIRFHLPGWIPFCDFLSIFLTCPHFFLYLHTLFSLVLATPLCFHMTCRLNEWSVYLPFLNHMINKLSLSLTLAEHLWMPYSIPKTQLAFLKPTGKFICQYGHIQIHLNCPKPFAKSLPIPSFKQRSMKLLIFLLNHSFQIFLPDFLHLNSFIPLIMSYPVFLQEWLKVQDPHSPPCFWDELEKLKGFPLDGMIPPSS